MGMKVRELVAVDRPAVEEMLEACGAFNEEEVRVALEMVDEAVGSDGEYSVFAAETDGRVCGYVLVGPTPLTASTWHLYWICVHPDFQGSGVGRALQTHVESFIRARGGERIVLETDGMASYERTREFYRRAGYTEAGVIPDYFKPGSDCVLFYKELK
jgi:ribosomal protein S18 acetylase RimI-like enzyme